MGDAKLPGERKIARWLHALLSLLVFYHIAVLISDYLTLQLYFHDAGHIAYAYYLTFHGRFFWSLNHYITHFAIHFTPTLLLLFPIHYIFRHILTQPMIDTLALMSGAWAVAFLMGGVIRKKNPDAPAFPVSGLALGIFYIGNPLVGSLQQTYHFENIAVALNLWALGFLVRGNRKAFWALFLLGCGVKEDMPFHWLAFAGWWMTLAPRAGFCNLRKARMDGFLIIIVGLIWMGIAFGATSALYQAGGQGSYHFDDRYQWLGDSWPERFLFILRNPPLWIQRPWPPFLILMNSVLWLPLLRPTTLLWLAPSVYMMGMSMEVGQYQLHYHYCYPFIPFLFLSLCMAWDRLLEWAPARYRKKVTKGFVGFCILYAALTIWMPTRAGDARRTIEPPVEEHKFVRTMLREKIPPDASVAASYDIFCQIPMRPNLHKLALENLDDAEYWAFRPTEKQFAIFPAMMQEIIETANSMIARGNARLIVHSPALTIVHVDPSAVPVEDIDLRKTAE